MTWFPAAEVNAKYGICLFSVVFLNVWDSTDTDLELKEGTLGKEENLFNH